MINYSVYEGKGNWHQPTRSITSKELFELITCKDNEVATKSKIIRDNYHLKVSGNLEDKGYYKQLKMKHLYSVVPGLKGNISRSRKESDPDFTTSDFTGYFTLDVDKIEEEQKELKEWFRNQKYKDIPYIHLVARSISGLMDGSLFVIVHLSDELFEYFIKSPKEVKDLVSAKFRNDTGLTGITANGFTQCRYISHDEDAYLNMETTPITKNELSIYIKDIKGNSKRKKRSASYKSIHRMDRYNKNIALDWSYNLALLKQTQCRGNNFNFLKEWIPLTYGVGLSIEDVYNYAHDLDFSDKDSLLDDIEYYYKYLAQEGHEIKLIPSTENLEYLNYKPPKELDDSIELLENEYLTFPSEALENKRLIIEAPAGSGKTTAIINHFENSTDGCIFLQPYKIVAEQKAMKFGWHLIKEGILPNKDKNQVGTFNAISKIMKSQDIEMNNSFLVVDEAHLMITDNFRSDVMESLFKSFDFFKGVILITATHIDATMFESFKLLKYSMPSKYKKFDLIQTDKIDVAMCGSLDRDSLNLVFLDNKNDQALYSDVLSKQGYCVEIMNNEKKETPLYQTIVKNEEITNSVNVILTTRFLSHGLDLFTSHKSINFVICPGLLMNVQSSYQIIQFINRFRKNENVSIKVIVKKTNFFVAESIGSQSLRESAKKALEASSNNVNTEIELLNHDESYPQRVLDIIERNSLIPDIDSDCYTFSQLSQSQYEYKLLSKFENKNIIYLLDYLHHHNLVLDKISTYEESFSPPVKIAIDQFKKETREQKKIRYQNEIINAYAILKRKNTCEDEKFYKYVKETVGGGRLLELSSILDNLRIARNILLHEGRNKYKKILRKAKILKNLYYDNELISSLRNCFEIDQVYSKKERADILKKVLDEFDSRLCKDFRRDYIDNNKSSTYILSDFFEIVRVNKKGIDGGYKVLSNNPFREYYSMRSSGFYTEEHDVYTLREVS